MNDRIIISEEESKPQMICNVDVPQEEMCFVMYLPIKFPKMGYTEMLSNLPANLSETLTPLLTEVWRTEKFNPTSSLERYVYVTIKRTFVSPSSMSQRMGWHIDGFGTDDINYIWYSDVPTQVCVQDFDISSDDKQSLQDMNDQASSDNIVLYPNGSLLRLDNKVVHRVSENHDYEGMRTFVKISISDHKFNLLGNAHNHLIDYDWKMYSRAELRNMEHNQDHA